MENKLKENKIEYNWDSLEIELGYKLPHYYKDFYEKYGLIGIDDYIYIVGEDKTENSYPIKEHIEYTRHVYDYLYTDEDEDFMQIKFYDGNKGWLPVGYTTNGDTIFCSNKEVMIIDEGFEEREIYEGSIEDFIGRYLRGEMSYDIGVEGEENEYHDVWYSRKRTK